MNASVKNTKTIPTDDGITKINKDNIPSNNNNPSQPKGSHSANNSWAGVHGTDMALVVKINVENVLEAIRNSTITTGFYDNTAYWVKKIYLYEYNFNPLFSEH